MTLGAKVHICGNETDVSLQEWNRCIMEQDERVVLCGASAYEKKFYLNPAFGSLPESIRQELQILCVLFTEDVGGVLTLVFSEEGQLCLEVSVAKDDYLYDEIGSELKIKEIQNTKAELMRSLELYYRIIILGMDPEEA